MTTITPTDAEYTWFRVIGSGISGAPKRSPDEACESFHACVSRSGWMSGSGRSYAACDHGSAVAAHSARLIEATTRSAALDADVSRSKGEYKRGHWRRA